MDNLRHNQPFHDDLLAFRQSVAYRLVLFCAVPLTLTPELVHLIRINLARECDWDTEADVLLAPFVERIGDNYYRIHDAPRHVLQTWLRNEYGEDAEIAVAELMVSYVSQHSSGIGTGSNTRWRNYLRAQLWAGLAVLAPPELARQLAHTLVDNGNDSELEQVVYLASQLKHDLPEQLLHYAQAKLIIAEGGSLDSTLAQGLVYGTVRLPDLRDVKLPSISDGQSELPQGSNASSLPQNDMEFDKESSGIEGVRDQKVVVGGALPPTSEFYIEREADRQIFALLRSGGSVITVTGARQMGKSSLCVRLKHWEQNTGSKLAFFDFSGLDQTLTGEQFYEWFVEVFSRQIETDADSPISNELPFTVKTTRFVEHCLSKTNSITLVFDEVEVLFQTSIRDNVFSMIRSWSAQRNIDYVWNKLNVVILASVSPWTFIADPNVSPFNVGERITLAPFNVGEFETLNERFGSPITESSDIQAIYSLTGGHPAMSMIALRAIKESGYSAEKLFNEAVLKNGLFGLQLAYLEQTIERLHAEALVQQVLSGNFVSISDTGDTLVETGHLRPSSAGYSFATEVYKRFCESRYEITVLQGLDDVTEYSDIYLCDRETSSQDLDYIYALQRLTREGFKSPPSSRLSEETLEKYRAIVVLVGRGGLTAGQHRDLQVAIEHHLPIIPATFEDRVYREFPLELETLGYLHQARLSEYYRDEGVKQIKDAVRFFARISQHERDAFYDQVHDLYISYSWKQASIVWPLASSLKNTNRSAWIDRNLLPGMDWQRVQDQVLKNSRVLLVAVSPDAIKSSGVQHEIELAIANNIAILPVIVQGGGKHPLLRHIQHLDLGSATSDPVVLIDNAVSRLFNPPNTKTHELFIIYSRDDQAFVYELVSRLRNDGNHTIWIDESELIGGESWWDSILTGIENSETVIIILSPHSVTSAFCEAELRYALALNKPILPLMLKRVDLPSNLMTIQYINISELSLDNAYSRCEQALERIQLNSERSQLPQIFAKPLRPELPTDKSNKNRSDSSTVDNASKSVQSDELVLLNDAQSIPDLVASINAQLGVARLAIQRNHLEIATNLLDEISASVNSIEDAITRSQLLTTVGFYLDILQLDTDLQHKVLLILDFSEQNTWDEAVGSLIARDIQRARLTLTQALYSQDSKTKWNAAQRLAEIANQESWRALQNEYLGNTGAAFRSRLYTLLKTDKFNFQFLIEAHLETLIREISPRRSDTEAIQDLITTLDEQLRSTNSLATILESIQLFGSLVRKTSIKPISDIDIMVNLAGFSPTRPPQEAYDRLKKSLLSIYKTQIVSHTVTRRIMPKGFSSFGGSILVDLPEGWLEILPAIKSGDSQILIPSPNLRRWIPSYHAIHDSFAAEMDRRSSGTYTRLIKLLKVWQNFQNPKTRYVSGFILECIVAESRVARTNKPLLRAFLDVLQFVVTTYPTRTSLRTVKEPGGKGEKRTNLSETGFRNFSRMVDESLQKIQTINQTSDFDSTVKILQDLFGPQFPTYL